MWTSHEDPAAEGCLIRAIHHIAAREFEPAEPRDRVGSQSYMHYHADYNTGTNTIHAGGERESYLLLPVIPRGN
ncbi:MAG: hypothetical protein H7125_04320 [Proteobacteria bacterium]|nr:hypothetical protein [Burkholderiales bacterium]